MFFFQIWCQLHMWIYFVKFYQTVHLWYAGFSILTLHLWELWRGWDFSLPWSHGCQQKTWDSRVRDKGLYYSQEPWGSCLHQLPLTPKYHGVTWRGAQVGAVHTLGWHQTQGTLSLGNLSLWKELQANTAQILPQRQPSSLLYWAANKPALASEGNPLSVFQGYLLYKHPWTDSLEQKTSVPLLIRHAVSIWETHRELPPHNMAIKMYIYKIIK